MLTQVTVYHAAPGGPGAVLARFELRDGIAVCTSGIGAIADQAISGLMLTDLDALVVADVAADHGAQAPLLGLVTGRDGVGFLVALLARYRGLIYAAAD